MNVLKQNCICSRLPLPNPLHEAALSPSPRVRSRADAIGFSRTVDTPLCPWCPSSSTLVVRLPSPTFRLV